MCEFSDLNLNITHLTQNEISSLVEFAIELGYNNLALATDFEFPAKKEKQQQIQFPKRSDFQLSAKLNEKLRRLSRKIKVLDRITIKIKDNDLNTFLHHLKSKEIMKFDIVALSPASSNVLQATDSLGINFELNYNLALSSAYARRDFIMLGRSLAFNTKQNSLILSSNASSPINLRSPYDLLVIARLFDINEEKSHNIVRYCPSNVILKSFIRKHTAAGIVYFDDNDELEKLKKFINLQKKNNASEKRQNETAEQDANVIA